ncbi:MAG: hypothetical protein R3C41_13605 [Calditrichia bacterium]|nr:hypothetical protein [Calditrichota bacterium]MCB0270257.1 hypothetical protein [Calditrichota bacterium]MCB0285509.1 hypothetical protein [Calditrichota bacterium]MCB9067140.1 hypothetical protein [Calditrichia bacterium]
MQVSGGGNAQLAMRMLQQAQQQQLQMAQATIQMAQAQENAQNGQQLLGSGNLVDVYA